MLRYLIASRLAAGQYRTPASRFRFPVDIRAGISGIDQNSPHVVESRFCEAKLFAAATWNVNAVVSEGFDRTTDGTLSQEAVDDRMDHILNGTIVIVIPVRVLYPADRQ